MLDIKVSVKGDKIVIAGLARYADQMPATVDRALGRIVQGAHREAHALLSGPAADTGGYPVPVKTGHLRRMLDFVPPGKSKSSGGKSFKAARGEALLYDSAVYAMAIHEGRTSSAKFGARPFITDGFARFNGGDRATKILEEEIDKARKKSGL